MASSVFQKYFWATASSAFAKIFQIFAAIGVVWLLNAILGKADFGLFMIVFALYYILAEGVANLFQSLILYHEADDEEAGKEASTVSSKAFPMTGACLFYGFIIACFLSAALYGVAAPLAAWMAQEDALMWFQFLGAFIPFQVLMILLGSFYRARQHVPVMIFFQEFMPSFIRFVGLGVVWLFTLDPFGIVWIYILSYLLPFAVLYARAPIAPHFDMRIFTGWDVRYGLQSMVSQLVNKSSRNIILVVLGVVGGAVLTAEYTIASRIAQLLNLPKQALAQLQVPRLRSFLKSKAKQDLKNEYDNARIVMFLVTILGVMGVVMLGEFILSLFGDYAMALPILLVLAIGSLIHAGFGIVGGYIIMAGYAGWGLFWNSVSLLILCLGTVLLVPSMGGEGAAWAMVLSIFSGLGGMVLVILKKDSLALIPLKMLIWLLLACTLTAFYALNILDIIWTIGGLVLIFSIVVLQSHARLISFLEHQKESRS